MVKIDLDVADVSYLIQYLRVKLTCYDSMRALTPSMVEDMHYLEDLICKLSDSLRTDDYYFQEQSDFIEKLNDSLVND